MTTCTFCPRPWLSCDPGDAPEITVSPDGSSTVIDRPAVYWCGDCLRRTRLAPFVLAEIAAARSEAALAPVYRGGW